MYLGTVTGRVVATIKDEALETRTLLLVRRSHDGKTVVAVDSVGAGYGEHVYVCRGREASFAFRPEEVPSDATVVGIVDEAGLEAVAPPSVEVGDPGDSDEAVIGAGDAIVGEASADEDR